MSANPGAPGLTGAEAELARNAGTIAGLRRGPAPA
jgi:hypothetical protein